MIKNYPLLLIILIASAGLAQNRPFITTWEVGENGLLTIIIPTEGTGYDYSVDFGDGTLLNNQTGTVSHTYAEAGTYTVSINGDFPRICYGCDAGLHTPSFLLIRSVEQWGDIQWQSMERAFYNCHNLIVNATDVPDLSQVTDLSFMFYGNEFMNIPLNHWDVSTITNMASMLGGTLFNHPLDAWDVSNVTDMSGMFSYAMSFNQNINNWDVSNVVDMAGMFSRAEAFNQPLDNWDVSNVTKMGDTLSFIYWYTGGMFESTLR